MSDFFSGPLPYFTVGPWELGGFKIHIFGVMVAIGVLTAHTIALRRVERFGYDPDQARVLYLVGLFSGFVFSHIFNVLLYEPATVLENPAELFRINGSLSSYGGVLGALIGIFLYSRFKPDVETWAMAAQTVFAIPFGWFFGRVGCALVHDHPGAISDFFLAVNFGTNPPNGIRHDLGLYEAIWWLVIAILFFLIDKYKDEEVREPHFGFYAGLLGILYTPVRFSLDFLRVPAKIGGDSRYFGLTPGQYFSILGFCLGIFFMRRWMTSRQKAQDTAKEPDVGTDRDA